MNDCEECIADLKAMEVLKAAHDYELRRFIGDGSVSYNPDEAVRLGRRAVRLSNAAPVNHHHSVWYASEHDDPAMMEVDPDAFYAIKEHRSDSVQDVSFFKHAPLELWADFVKWWK